MKNGIHQLGFKAGKRFLSFTCQVRNGFRDRIILIKPTFATGLSASLVILFLLGAAMLGVYLFAPEHGLETQMAIVPALAIKFKMDGLEGDDKKAEREILTALKERITIEGLPENASKEEINAVVTKAVAEAIKGFKELDVEKLSALLDKDKGVIAVLQKQGTDITQLRLTQGGGDKASWKNNIRKAIEENSQSEEMKRAVRSKSGAAYLFGSDEYEEKAVGNITTGSVATDTGGNAILDLINADDLKTMNLQQPFIEQFATVTRTSKPVYTYADYIPKEGDVAFLAESAAKSQLDLKLQVRTVSPKKAAGYEVMSTEAIQDIPRLQSEATMHVLKKYLLKRQNGILFGDGLNDTPLGVTAQASAFDYTKVDPNADPANKVSDPNLYDCIIAAATQIFNSFNYTDENEYYPNVAFMNPTDLYALKLKKNEFGMYLFPQFQMNQGNNEIDNLKLVAKRQIPAGKLLIGDFTMLRIINYIDYSVKMGWINDQFIKNLFTMVGEGRFYTVIRNLDKLAFIYDDISDIRQSIAQA